MSCDRHLSCDVGLTITGLIYQNCSEAVHSHKHTQMSSSYSSLDWVLSCWAHFTVCRFICVYLCVFSVFCLGLILHSCIIVSTVG